MIPCVLVTKMQISKLVAFVELQNQKFPSYFFLHQCCKFYIKLLQKQISITLLQLNLKIQEIEIQKVKFLKLKLMKLICYHNIPIFPKSTQIESTCKCQHLQLQYVRKMPNHTKKTTYTPSDASYLCLGLSINHS